MTDQTLDPQKAQQLEQGINQGVVAPKPEEILAEGVLDLSQFPIPFPDGNVDGALSDFDAQYSGGFDTLGCNIFADVSVAEIYMNGNGGDPDYTDPGGRVEFSERMACVAAGLNGLGGSSEAQWENMIANKGLVKKSLWPFLAGMTREQFYAPLPPEILAEAQKFLKKYIPFPRPVKTDHDSIKEALKYGAVKIFVGTGPGWNVGEPTPVAQNNGPMNHAVMVRRIDAQGVHIKDQYPPFLKVLPLTYPIYYAFQTLYKKKAQTAFVFTRDLWYGLTDPDCIQLQVALIKDGEFPATTPVDEHFGPVTLKAVQDFQRKYNIAQPGQPGYGRCGPLTRAKLNQLNGH